MAKTIHGILGLCLSLTFVACVNKGGGGSNPPGNNYPTYAESEYIGDATNLNSTEKGLEGLGLRLKTTSAYDNGLSKTSFMWDKDFLNSYYQSHPTANPKDMIPALENYIKVASDFAKKYAGTFNIKKTDGSVEAKQRFESDTKETDAKINLANDTISKVKNIQ